MLTTWPLQRKFALYAAVFSVLTWLLGVYAIRPLVYRHQVAQLDQELWDNAMELVRSIENFDEAPPNYFRQPIEDRFISPALQRRYFQIWGPEGQVLKRSKNLGSADVSELGVGGHTRVVSERNCRFMVVQHGFLRLCVGTRLGTLEGVQQDITRASLMVTPVLGVMIFAGAFFLVKRALSPVREITDAAKRIQAGNAEDRLPLPMARDDIHRLTEVLNESFERLQRAYGSAARFSADASHQLKTPLAVLRAGLDEFSANERLLAQDHENVEILRKQTRRLSALVDDLLLLAQMDAGKVVVAPQELDLSDHLLALGDDLSVLCETRGLEFVMDVPDGLVLRTDQKRLQIILQNLTENALKYTPSPGRIRLAALLDAGAGLVRIQVGNTGPAISAEAQERLFARFYRANTGENIAGHGLGLNISRHLSVAMGGELKLLGSTDEETCFQLTLPLSM